MRTGVALIDTIATIHAVHRMTKMRRDMHDACNQYLWAARQNTGPLRTSFTRRWFTIVSVQAAVRRHTSHNLPEATR